LLPRVVKHFENIIDIGAKVLSQKASVPDFLSNAIWRIFNGDPSCRRFFLTFGICHDDIFSGGSFAQKSNVSLDFALQLHL
jgi:hypothetical protein